LILDYFNTKLHKKVGFSQEKLKQSEEMSPPRDVQCNNDMRPGTEIAENSEMNRFLADGTGFEE